MVQNLYGDVEITAWDRDEVLVRATKHSADPRRLDDAQVVVDSSDGMVSIHTQYTGAEVYSFGKFSQLYRRFEIRAAFPASKIAGLQQALWMWPNNPTKYGAWPKSGEIDIAETSSLYADRAIPFIHYDSGSDMNVTNNSCMISNRSQMHRYTLTWTPTNMTIQYDGKTCISDNLPAGNPFDQPFFLALTAGLGVAPNAFTPGKTPLPAVTRIDYVRVWK